jgi:hypothetical protein
MILKPIRTAEELFSRHCPVHGVLAEERGTMESHEVATRRARQAGSSSAPGSTPD